MGQGQRSKPGLKVMILAGGLTPTSSCIFDRVSLLECFSWGHYRMSSLYPCTRPYTLSTISGIQTHGHNQFPCTRYETWYMTWSESVQQNSFFCFDDFDARLVTAKSNQIKHDRKGTEQAISEQDDSTSPTWQHFFQYFLLQRQS